MADLVKLYGAWFSPFATRVKIVLKFKGIEFEYVEEDLRNKSSFLLENNPIYKKVPVLIHNGNPIVDSLIIVEYIDEAFSGPSFLPKDPYERSKARFWSKFVDDKGNIPLWIAYWRKGGDREKTEEEAIETLKILENEINGKKFFGGDNIGLVDIVAGFIPHWFPILEELTGIKLLTEDKFPNLFKWAHEYSNHALVKENAPPKDRLVAALKNALETGSVY